MEFMTNLVWRVTTNNTLFHQYKTFLFNTNKKKNNGYYLHPPSGCIKLMHSFVLLYSVNQSARTNHRRLSLLFLFWTKLHGRHKSKQAIFLDILVTIYLNLLTPLCIFVLTQTTTCQPNNIDFNAKKNAVYMWSWLPAYEGHHLTLDCHHHSNYNQKSVSGGHYLRGW